MYRCNALERVRALTAPEAPLASAVAAAAASYDGWRTGFEASARADVAASQQALGVVMDDIRSRSSAPPL